MWSTIMCVCVCAREKERKGGGTRALWMRHAVCLLLMVWLWERKSHHVSQSKRCMAQQTAAAAAFCRIILSPLVKNHTPLIAHQSQARILVQIIHCGGLYYEHELSSAFQQDVHHLRAISGLPIFLRRWCFDSFFLTSFLEKTSVSSSR